MISILSSEGLAPAASAPKQNKVSDPASKSDDSPFSSFVSRDAADRDANPNSDASAPDATTARPTEPGAEPIRPETALARNGREQIDPAIIDGQDSTIAAIEADAPRASTEADIKPAISAAPRTAQTAQTTDTGEATLLASDADVAAPTKRTAAQTPAGTARAEQILASEAEPVSASKTAQAAHATTLETADAATKLARGASETATQVSAPAAEADSADNALRITRQQDGADLSQTAQLASEADLATSTNKALLANAAPDAKAPVAVTAMPEALLSVAQPSSVSAPALTAGLTPVAPSIPLAAPSEINSIILNALKNGGEPQEQLIVQLDPPELGRVAIDFKFDAQGVQQITVTSENPEALRRLRELHFELTEALKEHGLSEQNLSFRQQADDQSQPAWQMPERSGSDVVLSTNEAAQSQPLIPRSNTAYTHPDRLDLTL